MPETSPTSQLDTIVARLLNETATAEDISQLEQLLLNNTAAQTRYLQHLDLHAEIAERATPDASRLATQLDKSATPAAQSHFTPRSVLLVSAAAIILMSVGVGIGRTFSGQPGPLETIAEIPETTDDGVAILVHAVDVEWEMDNPPQAGSVISPGTLKMRAGLAELQFYSGARLILEGEVDIDVLSVDCAECRRGRLRAFVPEPARGFSVLTPKFEVVDLGTEFGLQIDSTGQSTVQVFDGEVDVYAADGKRDPEEKRKLFGGNGLEWGSSGEPSAIGTQANDFASFHDVRSQSRTALQRRFRQWRQWNDSLKTDPRIAARYDFQSANATELFDAGPSATHGSIVGCQPAKGRWLGKGALEFSRPADRARVNIPGEFQNLTLTAWVRVDAQPGRRQSLLLTDRHEIGRVHWQIGPEGELRLGTRLPKTATQIASGYASAPVFTPKHIGTWSLVCSVYDATNSQVRHYLDGQQVSQHAIITPQAIQIGPGDIGNWSVPLERRRKPSPVRNFVGRIDELTVWNVALTTSDIANIYSKTHP